MRPKIALYRPGDVYHFAHLKRDGIWITLERCAACHVRASTRHPTDITEQLLDHPVVEHFQLASRSLGAATLYCELYAPGHPASYVKHALAARKLDELRLVAFASPDCHVDTCLRIVEAYAANLGVPFAPWREGDWPSWETEPDAEGLVYKDGNLARWAKHKLVQSADVVCSGFTDGRGKYAGLIGAITLQLYDGTDVGRCGGMSDADRIRMSDDPDAFVGRVLEVQYQYVGSRGKMRHPRFVRWRDDKRPEECTEI